MNKQKTGAGIEWTQPFGRTGYTWNPIAGCHHDCQWNMPDGTTAICYAKTVAERLAQQAYPHGFAHHYWHPERLDEPRRITTPAGIFLDSMSDLMGAWVPQDQIQHVLDVCRQTPQHIYFLLTKNAPRLKQFTFPDNVWVGASMPPDSINRKALLPHQQRQMLRIILRTLHSVNASVKWMSFEPLSWDVADMVADHPGALNWSVIGAASNGRNQYPPEEAHVKALLTVLGQQQVPVFYKGNMASLAMTRTDWRAEFPPEPKVGA